MLNAIGNIDMPTPWSALATSKMDMFGENPAIDTPRGLRIMFAIRC